MNSLKAFFIKPTPEEQVRTLSSIRHYVAVKY